MRRVAGRARWVLNLVSRKVLVQAVAAAVLVVATSIDVDAVQDRPTWARAVLIVVLPLVAGWAKRETNPPRSAAETIADRGGLARFLAR